MFTLYTKRHGYFQNVASNTTATVNVPLGNTLHETHILFRSGDGSFTALADIISSVKNVRFKINGESIVNLSAKQLLDYHEMEGEENADGRLPIIHAIPRLESNVETESLALGTQDINNIRVEIDFDTLTNITTVECRGRVTDISQPLGTFLRFTKHNRTFSSTGLQELNDIPMDGDGKRAVIEHLFTKEFEKFSLRMNNREVEEDTTKSEIDYFLKRSKRKVKAGYTRIAFDKRNVLGDFILRSGINEFRYDIQWGTSPGSYDVIAVEFDNLKTN